MTDVPIDFASLCESSTAKFFWPTPLVQYQSIVRTVLERLVSIASAMDGTADEAGVFGAKLSNIYHDLARLLCLAADVANFEEQGHQPKYVPSENPIFEHLFRGRNGGVQFHRDDWRRPSEQVSGYKKLAKRAVRRLALTVAPSARFDVFSRNDLARVYLESIGSRVVPIYPLLDVGGGSSVASVDPKYRELLVAIDSEIRDILDGEGINGKTGSRVVEAARSIAEHHLNEAAHDLSVIRRTRYGRKPGQVLLSGSPKYAGRIIGFHYLQEGKEVYRFAHGGDRAFFDDLGWGITELPFCTRYYCHSVGEARNMTNRYRKQRDFLPWSTPEFASVDGASRASAVGPAPGLRKKPRVVYVTSTYVGELGYFLPSFRCNDVIYAEWQVWLLGHLRKTYDVVVRYHPKSLIPHAGFLDGLASGRLDGPLDLSAVDADCLLFDFAGTVLVDAMMAGRETVLMHHPSRQIDPGALQALETGTILVECHSDTKNRIRADLEDVHRAVENAMVRGSVASDQLDVYR